MTTSGDRVAGRTLVWVILALLGAVIAAAVLFRRPLLHGTAQPPSVAIDALEPPLAQRLRTLHAAVIEEPYDAARWGALGCTYDVHDFPREAVFCYERAQRLDPDNFHWPYFLGRAAMFTDQEAAIVHFRRAVSLRDDYAPAHVFLGRGLFLQERPEEAARHFTRAAEIDAGLSRAHLGLAAVALARDEPAEALVHVERAIALGAESQETYWLRSEIHRRRGDLAAAERDADAAAQKTAYLEAMVDSIRNEQTAEHGVTLRWRRSRAESYATRGRPDLALAEWDAARRADPDSAEAHVAFGQLAAQTGDPDAAIAALRRGLELDAGLHEARNNLGALLVQRGQLRVGLEALQRSAAAMPDNADAHFNLAMAWRTAGRNDEALAVLTRTVAIDPAHARARFEQGVLLGEAGRLEGAVDAFRAVIDGGAAPRGAYGNLARALERLDRRAEAVTVLRAGRAALPRDASLARDLAWRLATSPDASVRRGAEAVTVMEAVCRATGHREPVLLDTLAAAYAEVGRYDDAVRLERQALDRLAAPGEVLRGAMEERLRLYEAGRAYRE